MTTFEILRPVLLSLVLFLSVGHSPAYAGKNVPTREQTPLFVFGGDGSLGPVLRTSFSGGRPFVVFIERQNPSLLKTVFLKGAHDDRGRLVLANRSHDDLSGYFEKIIAGDPSGVEKFFRRPVSYIFFGRETGGGKGDISGAVDKDFYAPRSGRYLIRASLQPSKGRSGKRHPAAGLLSLDKKALFVKRGERPEGIVFKGEVFLNKGKHRLGLAGGLSQYHIEVSELDNAPGAQPPHDMDFEKVNPTRYVAHVKGADKDFTLVFSEKYNRGWKAYVRGKHDGPEPPFALLSLLRDRGERSPIETHLEVNGFGNGWMVRAADFSGMKDFDVVIEFAPQRLIEAGVLVSSLAFVISGAIYFKRSRKKAGGK